MTTERDLRDESALEELRIGATTPLLGNDAVDLSDVLNTVLDRGAVVHGEVVIAVADIDLIKLNIGLLLQAVATADQHAERRARRAEAGDAVPGALPPSGPRSLAGAVGALPRTARAPGIAASSATNGGALRGQAREGGAAPVLASSIPAGPVGGYSMGAAQPAMRPGMNSGMNSGMKPGAESAQEPAEKSLNEVARGLPERINADAAGPETGLARLVLTLIEVLRKVLEHQAVRRMEGGRLTDEEVERLGLTLARLNDKMGELKNVFGLSEEDLQIDLGPLGRLK